MPVPVVHLKEGMRLGGDRYKLMRPLGRGSMAEVWSAMDRPSRGSVAIKVISELMALSSQARKRFEREMRAIGSIHHPNVVSMLDHGMVDDGRPFLVMEHVEGESLKEYMDRRSRLGVRGTVILIGQILEGLKAAHAEGIVHRDLKPANVFLAFLPSGRRRVKILDFGVAHMLDFTGKDGGERLTNTGSVLGSPRYMSLEVARGARDIDQRADLFSVGAIMYHALSGRAPFQGEGLGQILTQIFEHRIPPLSKERPDLPPSLVAFVDRALAQDSKDRHASAEEMKTAMAQLDA